MTELRPPPEHQDKPLHWVESCDSGPIVWERHAEDFTR